MPSSPDPIPARILNEWAYCPRLAILEHVHGEWADSAETVDGRRVHSRVDQEQGAWPEADALEGKELARSLWLTAPVEGITARLDLVEAFSDGTVRPVDYKRGEVPDVPEGAWLPERVQVCAQALVLRESGYRCEVGAIWFAASRRRVAVVLDDALIATTRAAVRDVRAAVATGNLPAPLVDSPRCHGCSLVPICLPDEIGLLTGAVGDPAAADDERLPRRLVPARDDGVAVHVATQGARVGLSGQEIVVKKGREELGRASLPLCSSLTLHGQVQVSTAALTRLMKLEVPVGFFTTGGWFHGLVVGLPHGNVAVRQAQYAAAAEPTRTLALARRFVTCKLRNQRTLLRRNAGGRQVDVAAPDDTGEPPGELEGIDATKIDATKKALRALAAAATAAAEAPDLDTLMGHEGAGARAYFGSFAAMLKPETRALGFDFDGRNRRPPTDPVNAALSFTYAMLARACTHTLLRVGLEPFLGFLHQPRHGRPALALDLMEEFRPILADSTVLTAFNNGELRPNDFIHRGPSCNLTEAGRKRLIATWERRLDQLVTHPVFGYRISYSRVLEVQARLLARHLLGEIDDFPPFEVR